MLNMTYLCVALNLTYLCNRRRRGRSSCTDQPQRSAVTWPHSSSSVPRPGARMWSSTWKVSCPRSSSATAFRCVPSVAASTLSYLTSFLWLCTSFLLFTPLCSFAYLCVPVFRGCTVHSIAPSVPSHSLCTVLPGVFPSVSPWVSQLNFKVASLSQWTFPKTQQLWQFEPKYLINRKWREKWQFEWFSKNLMNWWLDVWHTKMVLWDGGWRCFWYYVCLLAQVHEAKR